MQGLCVLQLLVASNDYGSHVEYINLLRTHNPGSDSLRHARTKFSAVFPLTQSASLTRIGFGFVVFLSFSGFVSDLIDMFVASHVVGVDCGRHCDCAALPRLPTHCAAF